MFLEQGSKRPGHRREKEENGPHGQESQPDMRFRMRVGPPTHISNLQPCTVVHRGADVTSLDSCTSLEQTVYQTSNP